MTSSRELTDLAARSTTSAASDVLMKRGIRGYMRQRVRPLDMRSKMFGPALTIERNPIATMPEARRRAGASMIDAIESAPAGTVLVFNGDPEHEAALWGGLLAAAGHRNGLAGVVADGPVRDPLEILQLEQPCFCTGSVPQGQAGILTLVAIGEPVSCGGITVSSGDHVFGDSNGVVVIPRGLELEILQAASEIEEADQAAARMILAGTRLTETMRKLGRV
jgi:4-hydroxy-4-methyl-2-oxoglutarate aldolase